MQQNLRIIRGSGVTSNLRWSTRERIVSRKSMGTATWQPSPLVKRDHKRSNAKQSLPDYPVGPQAPVGLLSWPLYTWLPPDDATGIYTGWDVIP